MNLVLIQRTGRLLPPGGQHELIRWTFVTQQSSNKVIGASLHCQHYFNYVPLHTDEKDRMALMHLRVCPLEI